MDLVRNSGSLSAEYLVLDAFDIWGTIQAAPPAITSLSPAGGSTAGGTAVTINGTGFTGATSVTFGGASVLFTVNSSTKITATAPAHESGAVPVQVTTPAGSTPDTAADDFTYAVAPPTTRLDVPATTTGGLTTSGTWAPYSSASAYGASYLRSSAAGAYLVITFNGTQLDWITMKGTTGAKADIYVDGSRHPGGHGARPLRQPGRLPAERVVYREARRRISHGEDRPRRVERVRPLPHP